MKIILVVSYTLLLQIPMILLHTQHYQFLAKELATLDTSYNLGIIESKFFPDGEQYHRLNTIVRDKDVAIIGGTITDAETMELFDFAVTSVQNGAKSITLIIPYFGYSTMERAVKSGEIVKAKNRAILFSAIPLPQMQTRIMLFDLHSDGIPYYFGPTVQPQHIYCKEFVKKACAQLAGEQFVLAATDAGRAKWVESLASELHCEAAFVYKQRIDGATTSITGVNADVAGKTIIIYDDMIRTGGSLMQAAAAYKAQGAKDIFVITTHGLFNNKALQKISEQGIIKKIICTNTHPNALQEHPLLEVHSIASLIHENLFH